MKTIMKFIAPAALMMLGLASCGEDSWNNHLDGFEGGENMDQVVPGINYTLTAADYKRFADNRFNKALAAKEEADGTSPWQTSSISLRPLPPNCICPTC